MSQKIFKIKFIQVGEVYEIYAKNVYQSDFYGFIEIEGYIFNSKNNIVIDTSEEKLKSEFSSVKKTLIPINTVLRIDEVNELGTSKILKADGENSESKNFFKIFISSYLAIPRGFRESKIQNRF